MFAGVVTYETGENTSKSLFQPKINPTTPTRSLANHFAKDSKGHQYCISAPPLLAEPVYREFSILQPVFVEVDPLSGPATRHVVAEV